MQQLPGLSVKSLTFSDGKTYEFGPNDKVIIVGPNNSGKSLALREIRQILSSNIGQDPFHFTKCIKGLELKREGSSTDLRQYITNAGKRDLAHPYGPIYLMGPYRVNADASNWYDTITLGDISNLYVRHVSTENRLKASDVSATVAAGEPKVTAQQIMYDNENLFAEISAEFNSAFGESLVIDYRGGSVIPIHVGDPPTLEENEDRVSDSYVAKVRELPRLDAQGDGMRSFAGILFEATVVRHDITLIDEPEAFLHPPQMRQISRSLARNNFGQLFVSTHSSDILRGFIDISSSNVRIIRIQRDGATNRTKETDTQTIKELWENPDLKYSNALDGIFHELRIICEDDSDCRFYNALADHLSANNNKRWPDAIYVPCGGKHGIPKLASALFALGVPVRIAVDLDALSSEDLMKRLVHALGSDWKLFQKDWNILNAAVTKGVNVRTTDEIKQTIRNLIDTEPGLPKGKIEEAMKADSSWNIVKNSGKAAIPKGQSYQSFESLDAGLRRIGIYLVPAGQIEGFVPSVGLHGPAFVAAALRAAPLNDIAFKDASDFVSALAGPVR